MAYVVALASAFLVVSAATALRPGRRGIFGALAYPVGWAAGELAGQGIAIEGALLGLLWWWGWPRTNWLSLVVVALAAVVTAENAVLIAILFRSRTVVRRAMAEAPEFPLEIPRPRDDHFGRWWRTALQIPFHPRDMALERNVAYGPAPRHRLDVWRRATLDGGAPVIYYLHGGAWTFGDKREQGRPMLHEFVERGWIVVASNYRLAPRDPWPAQIEDAARGLAWIKSNVASYGGDPGRVVVAGGSAGGHLAALLALGAGDAPWRPGDGADEVDLSVRGALSFYGVLEMTGDETHWRGLGQGLRSLLERRVVQLPYEGNEHLYADLSPFERITAGAPPFFVVQGANDTLVEVNVARAFVERFRRSALAPIYYVELPFTQHSFDVTASPRTSATTRAAVAFAESVVAADPPAPGALAAYRVPPTNLRVEVTKGQWLEARAAAAQLGPYAVVTSDNPGSQRLSNEENAARRRQLADFVARRGAVAPETRASDPSGVWPEERGLALAGPLRSGARGLARQFGQFAYYDVERDGVIVRRVADNDALP